MLQKNNFYRQTLKLIKTLGVGLLMFWILKLIFIFRFGNLQTFADNIHDLPLAIWRSSVSDMQVVCYLLFLIYLLNFLSLIRSEKIRNFINGFSVYYISGVFTVATITAFVNQEYYSFFKLNFNPVVFDFLDESPLLLMKSMWQEHPVILILISIVLFYLGLAWVIKRIYLPKKISEFKLSFIKQFALGILITIFFAVAMRGSLGTFPLEKEDMLVSKNEFVNICVPNPLYSLKDAYVSMKNQFDFEDINQIAPNRGFKSIEEAVAVFYDVSIDSVKKHGIHHYIFQKSSNNLPENKYNVVFFIMESMSNALIDFHSQEHNLLGAWEKHLKEDIFFRNFQSMHNGTILSLEHIVASTPYDYVFDSKYRYYPLGFSIAKPFKNAGYKTNFTTGISLGWRHIGEALKNQHFDEVYGKRAVLKNFPQATANNTWGVYDHCVFDYIFEELKQSDSSMFVLSLSSTNHTPYELPPSYKPYKINEDIYKNESISLDKETCTEVMTAFQYSNDAVGLFMDKIKASELAENTIVIVTGDHNNRSALNYNTPELLKVKYSVPLYLYLPKKLRDSLYIDTERWGSHIDIMSSIFPYILKDVAYPCLGQNLFDKTKENKEYYSTNAQQILYSEDADNKKITRKVRARDAILRYYYSSSFRSLE